MTYKETVDFLYQQLPMYQRVGKAALKKDLTNTTKLLAHLDNPHNKFKSVHIAGTNGKGSSAHGIASILQSAGFKVGLYTSPHLREFTERIKIDGQEIDQKSVTSFVEKMKEPILEINPSFFEITVAMAFDHFANENVDIAIIETGLGGRLDSTNVIVPEVSLITNIGYDHTDLLGETLPEIAHEKAGIIKEGVPVVIGTYQQEVFNVFKQKASDCHAELIIADGELPSSSSQWPYHKKLNYPGIRKTIEVLSKQGWKISSEIIDAGYKNFEQLSGLKGRFQVLNESPKVIADVSHNKEGLEMLFNEVLNQLTGNLIIIYGTVKDKVLEPILRTFPSNAMYYWTQSHVPRALAVEQLQKQAETIGLKGKSFSDVNQAISNAIAHSKPQDCIVVTGSTFVVAEIEDL